MSDILGKKRFTIDQPSPPPRQSVAGSGIMVLLSGTTISDPTLDIALVFENPNAPANSPAFDAPTIAWT